MDLKLLGFDLRDVEHVVDQLEEVARAATHHAELFRLLGGQGAGEPLEDDPCEADDRVERSAKLVRHRGEEGGLDAVGGLRALERGVELLGARRDLDLERLVQLPQRRLGLLSLRDVDAHPDEARSSVELDSPSGEKKRGRAAVFRQERRLDGRLAGREDLGDSLLERSLVVGGEKVERMHSRDLVARVLRNALEVPIPPQEAACVIVEVHDAGHALDHRVGEEHLAARPRLRQPSLFSARQVVERERHVVRRLRQQCGLLVLEEAPLFRVDGEGAAHSPIFTNWKDRRRAEAESLGLRAPRRPRRILEQIVGQVRAHFAERSAYRPLTFRQALVERHGDGAQVVVVVAPRRDGRERLGRRIVPADPRHAKPAFFDQDTADLAKELVAPVLQDDDLVHLTERRVEARQPRDLALARLHRGHVARDLRRADDLAARVSDGRRGDGDVDEPAVLVASDRLQLDHPLAASKSHEEARLLVDPVGRDEEKDGGSDHLGRGKAEERFGTAVPARHDAVQVFADDRVLRRLDDRREPPRDRGDALGRLLGPRVVGDVARDEAPERRRPRRCRIRIVRYAHAPLVGPGAGIWP